MFELISKEYRGSIPAYLNIINYRLQSAANPRHDSGERKKEKRKNRDEKKKNLEENKKIYALYAQQAHMLSRRSIILCMYLEIRLRVRACRAYFRGFWPFMDVAAVSADPSDFFLFLEYMICFDIV